MSSNGRHYPVELDLQDVQFTREGPDITICSSKPDHEGQRQQVGTLTVQTLRPASFPAFQA